MSTISLTSIANGQSGDATVVNNNFTTIATAINGNLDTTNFTAANTDLSTVGKAVAWSSWNATLANLTLGNGTVTTKYIRLGNFVAYRFTFVLGSTSAVGSGPTFTLPTTAASYGESGSASSIIGQVWFENDGVTNYQGVVTKAAASNTTANIFVSNVSATYIQTGSVTATVPFTFGTGDSIIATGFYEAA
jgi:hypothetical protein